MEDTKSKKKRILGLVLTIVVNLLIVGYIAFREFGAEVRSVQTIEVLDIRLWYLLFAVLCFGIAVYMEYVKYRRMIMTSEGRDDRHGALECAILGKYYDNITPLGAGGQPFQIYYLKKRGLSTGSSAAIPIAGFLALQFAFILVAIVVFITNRTPAEISPVVRVSAYIGLLFYMAVPAAVICFAVMPKPFRKMVGGVTSFLGRLRILKDADKTSANIFASLDEYITSLRIMTRRKFFFAKMLFFSVIYQVAIMSIPYFVLRAFGGANGWWKVFSLVVYIYAAITIIPTPGNAGAAEGSFYAVFSTLEGGFLFWAMIIWRVLVYYMWLLLGLIAVTRRAVTNTKPRGKTPVPAEGPLNIAEVCDLFFPSVDGVVRTVDAYARGMTKRGHYCCVVCPRLDRKYTDTQDYDVFRTPSLYLPGFTFHVPLPIRTAKLKKLFRERTFHVLHAHSPFMLGNLAIRLGRKYNIPVVATFHSKYYDDALNITHSRFLSTIVMNFVVDFYSRVDEVWACSRTTAETLRGYGYNGEIKVMENGVEVLDIPDISAERRRACATLGIPEDRHVLLFVGQTIWHKNLRLVLDTAKLLAERGRDCITIIAGEGYHGAEIRKYAESLDLGDRVMFIGRITDRPLLYGLYDRADLFFFPSLYDNAPLVLREAALAGTPALLAEGSNTAEIVHDGYNGYTAAPAAEAMADKIEEIFASGKREEVGRTAQKTIPVSWDDIVDSVLFAYRKGDGMEYRGEDR